MKKILYFTPNFEPQSSAAAVRSGYLVKKFREKGFEVTSLSSGKTKADQNFFFTFPSNKRGAFYRLYKQLICGIELFFRILFSNYDAYILSSPPFVTVLIGAFANKLRKKKYYLDIRDIYPEVFFELNLISKSSFMGKVILQLTETLYANAEHIFTTSQGQMDAVLQYNDSVPVTVVRNGYDEDLFKPGSEKFKNFTVVFHGNLGHFQDIEGLIQLAKDMNTTHPEIEFLIIGDGPHRKLIENANLSNVIYMGQVNHQELPALISKAHLGISLRTDDLISKTAIPVKMYEYLGVEVPVIVAPGGEAADLVTLQNIGRSCNTLDLQQIKRDILFYYEDEEKYQQTVKNIQFNKIFYSREQSYKTLESVL